LRFFKWSSLLITTIAFTLIFSFWPTVSDAASFGYKIEVNKATNRLYLYQGNQLKKVYPVATGRQPGLTPEGTFPVVIKINKPGWKGIPGGDPKNPLGERWLGLRVNGDQGRTYGIHGTNQPGSIGKYVSNGCIRMRNQDVIELSKLVPTGTPVWIHSGKSNQKPQGKQNGQPVLQTATITGNHVHIRTAPSLSAAIIGKLNKGARLSATGKTKDWVQVKLADGRTAYVHQNYIRVQGNTGGNQHSIRVGVFLANIRSQPSLSATILQRVPKGMVLTAIGKEGHFYKLRLKDGSIAYIHEICIGR
jgi:SH3-like domain-containing protein